MYHSIFCWFRLKWIGKLNVEQEEKTTMEFFWFDVFKVFRCDSLCNSCLWIYCRWIHLKWSIQSQKNQNVHIMMFHLFFFSIKLCLLLIMSGFFFWGLVKAYIDQFWNDNRIQNRLILEKYPLNSVTLFIRCFS